MAYFSAGKIATIVANTAVREDQKDMVDLLLDEVAAGFVAEIAEAGAIDEAVEAEIAAQIEDGGAIDDAIDALIAAGIEAAGVIDEAIDAVIAAELEADGAIDDAIDAVIAAELEDGGAIDSAVDGLISAAFDAIEQGSIADLDQDISSTYSESEVQAISDKVDALLAALRLAGIIAQPT